MTEQTPSQKRAVIYTYNTAPQDSHQMIATDIQIRECLEYAQKQGCQMIQIYQDQEIGSRATSD